MSNFTLRGVGRFTKAAVLAMAAATALGLVAQRWMTYELLYVDGGVATWLSVVALLAVMGVATALLVGVPSHALTSRLRLGSVSRAFLFCLLASAVTTILHQTIAPFASTTIDRMVVPALCLVFFGTFYAFNYSRLGRRGEPKSQGAETNLFT